MIRKVSGGYKIRTHTGKMLGKKGGKPFRSRAAAEKREKQIRYFKHRGK